MRLKIYTCKVNSHLFWPVAHPLPPVVVRANVEWLVESIVDNQSSAAPGSHIMGPTQLFGVSQVRAVQLYPRIPCVPA